VAGGEEALFQENSVQEDDFGGKSLIKKTGSVALREEEARWEFGAVFLHGRSSEKKGLRGKICLNEGNKTLSGVGSTALNIKELQGTERSKENIDGRGWR